MAHYCGEIGLSLTEFYDCTMQDLYNINSGFLKRKETAWLHTRSILATYINMNSKDKVRPQDIIPLSCDKNNLKSKLSQEEKQSGIDWALRVEKIIRKN